MNIINEYEKFIEKYPEYAKKIVSYNEGNFNSIEFIYKDGHKAIYFPIINGDMSLDDKDK